MIVLEILNDGNEYIKLIVLEDTWHRKGDLEEDTVGLLKKGCITWCKKDNWYNNGDMVYFENNRNYLGYYKKHFAVYNEDFNFDIL